ncbi:hypothetical protein L210DRAFT_3621871 [Boletus edulis BED1]|uniref:Uncharacterized protein n=1 Tax=Boletus edulis BED1 TaxID=1328754 RepID=A0AAD4BT50_BOLED|nr:hypothetical protein L210DRAFT_3621871 [Boletus edulis BED1]
MSPPHSALSILLSAALVSAYSFTFTSKPQQCANLSLQISGSGKPPYSVLIIPYGPSPLSNNVEVRTIVSQQFSGDDSSLSFQLKFPANSQFVAVVSDSSGFGSGGTSVAASVLNSSDTSCFNATHSVSPDFPYNINPANQVVQCSPSRLWWTPSQVQGTPNFQGVIPGGDSFSIPVGTITNVTDMGTGFQWVPTVRAGTTLLVVSGDNRGLGTGGSDLFTVSAGLFPNSSCATNTSPSSTAGPPAGGSYPTNASGGTTSGSSGSNNTGAIVGGVVGGLAAIVVLGLVAFYIIRRKTGPTSRKERPVNLLHGDPDDNEPPSSYQPPPYLQPDPYLVTAPTISSTSARTDHVRNSALLSDSLTSSAWRQSAVTSLSDPRSTTPELDAGALTPPTTALGSSRKSGMSRQLRAVNIIQHEDAGPSSAQEPAEPETIELPPAYTNLRKEPN